MPQVDLKYSACLALDVHAIFSAIEVAIAQIDKSAGICKSRAYPAPEYHHTHLALSILVLKKPHRNPAFMKSLLKSITDAVLPFFPTGCYYAISLDFAAPYYLTEKK